MRRRQSRRQRAPISGRTTFAIFSGLISLALLGISIFIATLDHMEEYLGVLGAVGTVCVLVSFVTTILSLLEVVKPDYNFLGRFLGLLLSLAPLLLWTGVYLYGMASL